MKNPFKYLVHHKVIMGVLVFVVILVTAVFSRLSDFKKVEQKTESLPKVSLISLKEFVKDKKTVSANGTIESLEQAELKSQASGPVTKIYAQIGSKVSAGQVLVSLQNSDVSAQLAQAEAGLKAQEAKLSEMKNGTRSEQIDIIRAKVDSLKQTLADVTAQQEVVVSNALNTMLNTGLAAVPDSGNSNSQNPTITGVYNSTKQGAYEIHQEAKTFYVTGLESMGNVSIDTSVSAPNPLGTSGLYITFPSNFKSANDRWTVSIPNTQAAGYAQANNAYKLALEAKTSAINGAKNALNAAEKELDLALAGATNQQLQAQEAAVDQARASVRAIAAQLEKTVIRSPINGTVSVLPVKYGELVSPGQLVVSVVNKGGLQVKAYISDEDITYLEQGAEAVINDSIKGVLARVSPSINPSTKNVEVNIAVSDPDNSGLVVGQSASVKINVKNDVKQENSAFVLPLQTVKIYPGGASVLVVNNDSVIEEKQVVVGKVSGENIEIISGLDENLKIVSTVYELKAGQKVSVENN